MKEFLSKLKTKKGIISLCIAFAALILIVFLVLATSNSEPEEETTTEITTEETTLETTTEETTVAETTTEETTTLPPETEAPAPVKLAEKDAISEGSLYGYLSCSKIGLSCSLYMGDDNYILKKGAGQIPATYLPGEGGLIMAGAHNNRHFNCLQYIEINDLITLETSYGIFTYQVVNTEVVDVTGKDAYDFFTDHEQLLLYTCYPFDTLSSTVYRFMVHADLVSETPITEIETEIEME